MTGPTTEIDDIMMQLGYFLPKIQWTSINLREDTTHKVITFDHSP